MGYCTLAFFLGRDILLFTLFELMAWWICFYTLNIHYTMPLIRSVSC